MTPDELRARFEAHFSQPPFEWSMTRQHEHDAWPGNYRHYAVHCAWEAWQACYAAMQGEDVRRDAERLDWLQRFSKTSTLYIDGTQPWNMAGNFKLRDLRGPTLRAAIDIAMGERHG